jgi:serine/threonine-protein kinase
MEEADSDDLRRRLGLARTELELAARLEKIRLKRAALDNPIAFREAARAYAATFREAGLAVAGGAETAALIRASAIREQLTASLDDWALSTPDAALQSRLLRLARWADPDPKFRDRLRDPANWHDPAALKRLAAEADVAKLSPQLLTALGARLRRAAVRQALPVRDAERFLRAAQQCHPRDFWLNFELAVTLTRTRPAEAVGFFRAALVARPDSSEVHDRLGLALDIQGRKEEALTAYRRAVQLDPNNPTALSNLASILLARGRLEEALAACRRAVRLDPNWASSHLILGRCLQDRGRLDEAMAAYRRALRLNPKLAPAHHQLGRCLQGKGRPEEAMAEYRRAIQLDPKMAPPHQHLGKCLQDKGLLDQAMEEYRRACELDPQLALAHFWLAACLERQGLLDEAMAKYRRASELDPNDAETHNQLGVCLQRQARLDEAITEYRRAGELDPRLALPHYNLAVIFRDRGRVEEAISEFRKFTQLDPGSSWGYEDLAVVLLRRGRFTEARTVVQRGLDRLPANHPGRPALQQKLKACQRLLALDARLPALLQGKERPAGAAEQIAFGQLCVFKQFYAAAARFYRAAFPADPRPVETLAPNPRYNAACYAALAGCGQGKDADRLTDSERARWRQRALDWLRADLVAWARATDRARVLRVLKHWQQDRDLAGVRGGEALAKLPPEERAGWQRLWADVAAALAADPRGQGRAYAARREWGRAADCSGRALKLYPTDDGDFWFEYAAVLLLSGDRQGYARACARLVERCGQTPQLRAYHVARACTLAADSVADAGRPGRLAREELTTSGKEFWSLTQQGALHYRAGRFQEAVPLLEQSLRAEPKVGRAVLNWLWLALANQRLGKAEEARRWLSRAQRWLDRYGAGMPRRAEEELGLHLHNWLEAHVLRREAEALLGARSK